MTSSNVCDFDDDEIIKVIHKIKIHKTPSPDYILSHISKETKFQISKPLSLLFTKSLNCDKVRRDKKLANVTLIHKKGDKSLPSNYRSTRVTSLICKLMEI